MRSYHVISLPFPLSDTILLRIRAASVNTGGASELLVDTDQQCGRGATFLRRSKSPFPTT